MDSNNEIRDLVILISGKRKSGKDYICERVADQLGNDICCILRISAPLKEAYAQSHSLNMEQLLSSGYYKEHYRLDMIKWSDEIREADPEYFCRLAVKSTKTVQVTLISDIRRKSDLTFFENHFAKLTKRIRIQTETSVRKGRGYSFTPGVDDGISECGLDDLDSWDLILNNNNIEEGKQAVKILVDNIRKWLNDICVSNN